MITARQHRPAFVDRSDAPHTARVETLAALFQIPWIAVMGLDDLVLKAGETVPFVRPFYRWSLSDDALMAEFDEGRHWWVVAFLTSDTPIDLPKWEPHPDGLKAMERWNRGDTSDA